MLFHYLCSAYVVQCSHTACSFRFHNVKCTHELFSLRFFFFFCFLFVIDSIHSILFITMLFIWHDFCFVALPFVNTPSCYYNLIWVIWCLTFTVIWCITLIWRSTQHHVYPRNSMTAGHKIAISNLIYFHQYLLMHHEFWMCFFFPLPSQLKHGKKKREQLFQQVSFPLYELGSKPLLSSPTSK